MKRRSMVLALLCAAVFAVEADGAGLASVEDVRVDSLLATHWGQKSSTGYSNTGSPCFNYCTPDGDPCGCVATALAQLCRYWEYPTSIPVGASRCLVNGSEQSLKFGGTVYDYAKMPALTADAGEDERQAVGTLTYDCAVAMHAQFGTGKTDAYGMFSFVQLKDVFGYANAVGYVPAQSMPVTKQLKNAIIANLDARSPVLINLLSSAVMYPHQAVIDGYGYDKGKLYFHFNMGWCNIRGDDAWYELDGAEGRINGIDIRYDLIDGLVYNVFPTATGDVLSGRVLDQAGIPVSNAVVDVTSEGQLLCSGVTDAKGIYAFVLKGGKTYKVACDGHSVTVALPESVSAKRQLKNKKDGDIWEDPFMPTYTFEGTLGGSSGNDIRLDSPVDPIDPVDPVDPERADLGPFNPGKAGKGNFPFCGAVFDGEDKPIGTISVKYTKPTKAGVSKVSASLKMLDGKTYTLSATPVNVDPNASVFIFDREIKKFGRLVSLQLGEDGFQAEIVKADGQPLTAATTDLSAGLSEGEHKFSVQGIPSEINGYPVISSLLPEEEDFKVSKGKISLPKAAVVKYQKIKGAKPVAYELIFDTSKGRTNLSGLKLTYTAKTASVKGSFFVYVDNAAKHKVSKVSFSVNGMVINGRMYAVATCKKPSLSIPVTVE